MSKLEIQNLIIEHISKSDDETYLNALAVIMGLQKSTAQIYTINAEQLTHLNMAGDDIKEGRVMEHDAVFKEMDAWIK